MKTKQQEIDELRERLDALEKGLKEESNERWKPNDGDSYYTFDVNTSVCNPIYDGDGFDNGRYESFNMFKTKEEAEKIAKYQLIFRKLHDFAKRNNGLNETKGSWAEIYFLDGKFFTCIVNTSCAGRIKFTSEEVAREAIEYIGEDDLIWYLTFKA